jgi:hypothetical protein
MNKSALFSIIIVLCFSACKKENNPEPLYYGDTLISQINYGKTAVQGITYNSNYLVYESMEPFKYSKYSYDDQNRLKRIDIAYTLDGSFSCSLNPNLSLESDPRKAKIGQYAEFEYDATQRLIKKSYFIITDAGPKPSLYYTYEYENNKIIKSGCYNSQGLLTSYNSYKYDIAGNIILNELYMVTNYTRLYQSTSYEYDNKNNPYLIFMNDGEPGKYTNKNNIVKETDIYYNGTTETRETIQNSYVYNDLDYPVKINSFDCLYGKLQ